VSEQAKPGTSTQILGRASAGKNLPDFRAVQLEFAAHIRNPGLHPKPADVDERRMRVYRELVYNNIEGFVAGAFPIAKKLLSQGHSVAASGTSRWHQLVRLFVHQHASTSPYFLEVSQEFLEFLGQSEHLALPPFVLELCHYEWVELALRVDERDIPDTLQLGGAIQPILGDADLLQHVPVVSPLARSLAYEYAVHRVRGDLPISGVMPQPTFLVVYRDPQDEVRFLEVNAMTTLLLELLDGVRTGAQALSELAHRIPPPEAATGSVASKVDERLPQVLDQGAKTLDRLRARSIILGALPANPH